MSTGPLFRLMLGALTVVLFTTVGLSMMASNTTIGGFIIGLAALRGLVWIREAMVVRQQLREEAS
jgi:hypothetical protein